MSRLHAGGLAANNLHQVRRQRTFHCLLVSILGSVLAMLKPFQHGLVATAQTHFGVDPGAMQRSENRARKFLVSFSDATQLRLQFRGEAATLPGLLVKKCLQVSPLHLRSRFLITLLSVLAGLDKFFEHTDSIIHVHDFLLIFGCPEGARVWQNSIGRNVREISKKRPPALKSTAGHRSL